jgi:hypothetical protein
MTSITTSNSIRVNADLRVRDDPSPFRVET